jgi:hypothetical protein
MRRDCVSKLIPLAVLFLFAAALPASASAILTWEDTLHAGLPTWHRPDHNLQEPAKGAPTPYSVQSIYVDQSGLYQIDSDVPDTEDPFPDGYVFLYAGSFDPARPLLNLIGGSEAGPDTAPPGHIASVLTAGAVYYVVTTSDDPDAGRFRDEVSGPGLIHVSSCAAHGSTAAGDASTLGLLGGRFCVSVTWTDAAGTVHTALPVPFRSDNSAAFWFFDPSNWELQVKLLDACKVNQHFWVMASGTTHLDYSINIEDSWSQSAPTRRSYHNKLGNTRALLDTQAFDGCNAGTAAHRKH